MATSEKKDHFRKVYKSDHLGVADLEDLKENNIPLIFTIKEVKQEFNVSVAGKKGDFNIAYFNESIKPLVLNATNSKIVKSFAPNKSPYVQDWKNIPVELFIDYSVKMKGDVVGGVRISPVQPKLQPKAKPFFTEANFEKAKNAGATIERIKEVYHITSEVELKFIEYVGN
jgi:hypothetical protein